MRDYHANAAKLQEFGAVLQPTDAQEPILSKPVRTALMEWLEEIWLEKELKAAGLQERKRALLSGKPGIGKTTLAHHLSARLRLPMLVVNAHSILDVWVNAGSRNIGDLFETVAKVRDPMLLFLDEFDSIAGKRGSGASAGAGEQMNTNMVNTLLQRLDDYKGFIIAATNNAEAIDSAVWRRFEIHIKLELPGQEERERIIARYLDPYGLPRSALAELALSLETATPALIRQLIEGMKRQIVLGPKVGWRMERESVIERVLQVVQPHAELGKPRLWAHGQKDKALAVMPWPLPMATDIPAIEASPAADTPGVVPFRRVPA